MHTISKDEYLEAGQIFHWATQDHYKLWFTGSLDRHRRTEQMMARLAKSKEIAFSDYGKKLVYAAKRMKNTPIAHGLGVTETIVRIVRSGSDGTIIPERYFRGLGSVPDWGIQYREKLLLCEFSTQNNFEGARIIKTKITKYNQNLEKILERFRVSDVIVLFVIDVPRVRVLNFIVRNYPGAFFFFTDFETFKSVPLGKQLTAPIYIWKDGESYPLKK